MSETEQQNPQISQEAELSMLQTLSLLFRKVSLQVSSYIRKNTANGFDISCLDALDSKMNEYKNYCAVTKFHRLTYFKIDPLSMPNNPQEFTHQIKTNSYQRQQQQQPQPYIANLFFIKDSSSYYRMHIELCKKDGLTSLSNRVINNFQSSFHTVLFQMLLEKGYVNYVQGDSIVLRDRMCGDGPPVNLPQTLTSIVSHLLKQTNKMIVLQRSCNYCDKYMCLSRQGLIMPPTFLVKEHNKIQIYHEACIQTRTQKEIVRSEESCSNSKENSDIYDF